MLIDAFALYDLKTRPLEVAPQASDSPPGFAPQPPPAVNGAMAAAAPPAPTKTQWGDPLAASRYARGMAAAGSTPEGIDWLLGGD